MKIRVSQTGGFAGIPIELADVDTAGLPTTQAERLERLVREAAFFRLPARADASPDAATIGADDALTYEITVEDAGRRHTVSFTDRGGEGRAAAAGSLRALVAALTQSGGPR
jgi:hypothetical protein